jgi:DNA-binding NarL/FixJ family response regulator
MFRNNQGAAGKGWNNQLPPAESAKDLIGDADLDDGQSTVLSTIIVVERNAFFRSCLHRSVADYWEGNIVSCGSLSELTQPHSYDRSTVVVLSIVSMSDEEADAEFAALIDLDPPLRCMVLAESDNLDKALTVLSQGANGYISMSSGFDIFVEALRFVGAGGTYVPVQCLLAARQTPAAAPEATAASGITSRELAVIQAIRQGKPNKVIAYELNMCESTVKVHVRHIMRKLQARNRTDVAIKGADLAKAGAMGGAQQASLAGRRSAAGSAAEH